MARRFSLLILTCLILGQVNAQTSRYDTVAVSILDKMSRIMGELNSVSVTVKTNYDVSSEELGLIKHNDIEHMYVGGPDKLMMTSEGDKGKKHYYYNGKTLTYYSADNNYYARVKTPSSVVNMIDSVSRAYGVVFPAADFLYPTFVDDILAEANSIELLGTTKIDGKECFHIAGTAENKTFQFWIEDDPFYLPVKMVIIYTDKPLNPQFEATYYDWKINPGLPASIFEFAVPPGAHKIKMSPLTVKNDLQ